MAADKLWTLVIRTKGTRETGLRDALDSFTFQNYPHKFLIVVIHSADISRINKVKKTITQSVHDTPFEVYLADPKKKIGHPINVALDHCNSTYVSFLDDDDILLPNAGSTLIAHIQKDKINFAYGKAIKKDKVNPDKQLGSYNSPFDPTRLVVENYIPTGSYIFEHRSFSNIRTSEEIDVLEDWFLLLKFLFSGKLKAKYYNIPVIDIRVVSENLSESFSAGSSKQIAGCYRYIKRKFFLYRAPFLMYRVVHGLFHKTFAYFRKIITFADFI